MTTLSTSPGNRAASVGNSAPREVPTAPAWSAPTFDAPLVLIAGALMTFGVAMVYSASVTLQGEQFEWRRWWNSPLRQCVFALLGFLTMIVAAHFDYRWLAWERRRDWWRAGLPAVLAAVLLAAVLIPGVGSESLGAQRSIIVIRSPVQLGFQPSELAKVVMVLWLAALLARPGADALALSRAALPRRGAAAMLQSAPSEHAGLTPRATFLNAVIGAGLLVALTGIEDYGTAALMGVIMMCMLYLARTPWRYLFGLVVIGAAAGAGLLLFKPYRLQRIVTFLSEAPDPSGEGYQVTQALIAIGSGGWWGRGLGAGVQKYGYLPQDNNDFVLAVVCEELGVAGGIVLAALFLLILWRGWLISARCGDRFGKLLAAGLTLTICLQAAFNIGVVTDSIPTKGISLPFVSAGGSGVLFLGVAAGLLASVARGVVLRTGKD
jgi:cell division protein FtsW